MAKALGAGDKVRVANTANMGPQAAAALSGKTGTIVRMKMNGEEAWVKLDEDLPQDLQSFKGEGDPRRNHRSFYLDELAPA